MQVKKTKVPFSYIQHISADIISVEALNVIINIMSIFYVGDTSNACIYTYTNISEKTNGRSTKGIQMLI